MNSNRNEGLLRQEFKRRYLTEFSTYVGGAMEESSGHSANFLFLFLTLFIGPLSFPVAGLMGVGVSARYARVQAGVKAALAQAVAEAAKELTGERSARLSHVEGWLDAHIDDLPGYLDRLDRHEQDRRRVTSLIARCNSTGSADGLSIEERTLLKRHGITKFKPPFRPHHRLPPRSQLGNRHFSQLDRALWRDISRIAGGRGKMLHRIIGLARP